MKKGDLVAFTAPDDAWIGRVMTDTSPESHIIEVGWPEVHLTRTSVSFSGGNDGEPSKQNRHALLGPLKDLLTQGTLNRDVYNKLIDLGRSEFRSQQQLPIGQEQLPQFHDSAELEVDDVVQLQFLEGHLQLARAYLDQVSSYSDAKSVFEFFLQTMVTMNQFAATTGVEFQASLKRLEDCLLACLKKNPRPHVLSFAVAFQGNDATCYVRSLEINLGRHCSRFVFDNANGPIHDDLVDETILGVLRSSTQNRTRQTEIEDIFSKFRALFDRDSPCKAFLIFQQHPTSPLIAEYRRVEEFKKNPKEALFSAMHSRNLNYHLFPSLWRLLHTNPSDLQRFIPNSSLFGQFVLSSLPAMVVQRREYIKLYKEGSARDLSLRSYPAEPIFKACKAAERELPPVAKFKRQRRTSTMAAPFAQKPVPENM